MDPSAPTEDAAAPLLTPTFATPRTSASSSTTTRLLFPDVHTVLDVEHEVCLAWRDLSCLVETAAKDHPTRVAFRDVAGWARGGEMLSILGPRGSGTQTLLEVLACQHSPSRVEGTLLLNGVPCDRQALQRWGRYVPRDNMLLPTATVEETVRFAAHLRATAAPRPSYGGATVEETVEGLLSLLCLQDVRHTRIDNLATVPAGGGLREVKMCAVAVALASSPSLILLEDPMEGLDAFSAMGVVASLSAVAASGVAVVLTASQPPVSVFRLFDKVLLLNSEGEQAYFGQADAAVEVFASLGVHPGNSNNNGGDGGSPADFLVSSVYTPDEALQVQVRRVAGSTAASRLLPPPTQGRDIASGFGATRLPEVLRQVENLAASCLPLPGPSRGACLSCLCHPFSQLCFVLRRSLVSLSRGGASFWTSVLQFLLFVLFVGALYYQVGLEQVALPRRMVVLFLITAYTPFFSSSSLETLTAHDAFVYARERQDGMYSTTIYYMGVALPHILFIVVLSTVFNAAVYGLVGLQPHAQQCLVYSLVSCLLALNSCGVRIVVSTLTAQRRGALAAWITSLLLVLFLLPAGRVLLHFERLPLWLRALEPVSFLRYAFAVLVSNEFEGLELNCAEHNESSSVCFATGQQYANEKGFYREDVWSFTALCGVHAFCYLFAGYVELCILQICQRRQSL